MRIWYIVYKGLQRYRDGSVKPRTRVKKLTNIDGKPRIVDKRVVAGELWVTVEAPQIYTLRNGSKQKRMVRRDIHLGRVRSMRTAKPRLTTKPPKKPLIERQKRMKKKRR